MKGWKMIVAVAAALIGAAMPAHAEVDISAKLGLMSNYTHRGIHQSSGTLNGEIKLTAGGFHVGAWAANLSSGDGGEYQLFGGVSWEVFDGLEGRLGFRGYRFTDDDDGRLEMGGDTGNAMMCVGGGFEQDSDEFNAGLGFALLDISFTADYTLGQHKNGDKCRSEDNDYDLATLRADFMGAYALAGIHGLREDNTVMGATEGEFLEAGYTMRISGFDVEFFAIRSQLDGDRGGDDGTRAGVRLNYGLEL